jgi:hypothetical protein
VAAVRCPATEEVHMIGNGSHRLQPELPGIPVRESSAAVPAQPDHARRRSGTVAAHLQKGQRRPPDTIWRANPREQGLIGLTDAIAWFGARGHHVLLPLIDSQPYDLVVDDGTRLQRVQVKTTTQRSKYGVYIVTLCTSGGNQSFHTRKPFEAASCDLLYALTDSGDRYLVPSEAVMAKTKLYLGRRMAPYWVSGSW